MVSARSLTSGHPVLALDGMPAYIDADETTEANLTNTTYAPKDPEVSVTFVAPTSGKVLLVIASGMKPGSGANRIHIAPETRVDDVSGSIVRPVATSQNAWTTPAANIDSYIYGCQISLVENLEPGQTYYSRAMLSVSGSAGDSTDPDINSAQLIAIPTA